MNETHLDDYIRKTVIEEMQSYAPPDPEKTWQKIEGTIDLFERLQNAPKKKRKPTARLKIAAVIVTLILTAGIIGFPQTGEAVP